VPPGGGIALFDAEPAFERDIPQDELSLARRVAVLPRVEVPAGPWEIGPPSEHGEGTFALLVVSGVLMRDVMLGDRVSTQLLGPGDVVDPWHDDHDALVPVEHRWVASDTTQLAVLEERFVTVARRWPGVMTALHARTAEQAERATVQMAICQLPRIEERLVAVLWLLAERWGRATGAGIVVPLQLTHEALGRLAGAQRPTVSLALRDLADDGAVGRRADGAWILREGTQSALRPAGAPAETVSLAQLDGPRFVRTEDRVLLERDREQLRERLSSLRDELPARGREVSELLGHAREIRTRCIAMRDHRAADRARRAAAR
jgi:CRP-like cAMP-binding protein